MSVFTKTNKGLEALRDLNSGMPRRMRTVLWCINGQTTTATLMRSLTSVGDVKQLMRALITEGLIERVHRSRASAKSEAQMAEKSAQPSALDRTAPDTPWPGADLRVRQPHQNTSSAL
jgi:hypothetical protein